MPASDPEASDPAAAGDQSRQAGRVKRLGNLLIALSALGVLVLGIWATRDVWHGRPVAAAFSRVAGATRVETAIAASRFWLTTPQTVVETPAFEAQNIMLGAARCAMALNAPLLFTSLDPKRESEVVATTDNWGKKPIVVKTMRRVRICLKEGRQADVDGLSVLRLANQPTIQRPPRVQPRRTLAPVVVFAAAWAPGEASGDAPDEAPDVAVSMALGAHMATPDRPVSLVVVPRYLEADPGLEAALGQQRHLVRGGVVLGLPPTLPEDTRILLRQLLTAPDQLGLIAQVQGDLANLGQAITALLALLAAGVLVREGPEIKDQTSWLIRKARPQAARAETQAAEAETQAAEAEAQAAEAETQAGEKVWEKITGREPGQSIPPIADLRVALPDRQKVTVWLRNGWMVTGTTGEHGSRTGQGKEPTVTVLQLHTVTLEKAAAPIGTAHSLLMPIGDIELIATGFSATANAGAPDPTATAPAATAAPSGPALGPAPGPAVPDGHDQPVDDRPAAQGGVEDQHAHGTGRPAGEGQRGWRGWRSSRETVVRPGRRRGGDPGPEL